MGRAVTLGVFDGLHLGHRRLVEVTMAEGAARGLLPTVVTLDPHPDVVLGYAPPRPALTPVSTQAAVLAEWGVEQFRVLRFDQALSEVRARQFVQEFLVEELETRLLVVGPDFALGHQREGTPQRLSELGAPLGMEVLSVPPLEDTAGRISSSRVRRLLDEGRVEEVAALLGRPHRTEGRVVRGRGIGAGLGFPTANLEATEPVYLPADGVYLGRASGGFGVLPCLISLGSRPTFGPGERVLEGYLLDFDGDLREQPMLLEWLKFQRSQQTFHDPADLVVQMHEDERRAREWLKNSARSG